MKLSELIDLATEVFGEHGDMEVTFLSNTPDQGLPPVVEDELEAAAVHINLGPRKSQVSFAIMPMTECVEETLYLH